MYLQKFNATIYIRLGFLRPEDQKVFNLVSSIVKKSNTHVAKSINRRGELWLLRPLEVGMNLADLTLWVIKGKVYQ
jgi:hypothetical protein